jgi:hypothetical protein
MHSGMPRAQGMPPSKGGSQVSCSLPSANFTERVLKSDSLPPWAASLFSSDFLLMLHCVTRLASGDAFRPWDFLMIPGWIKSCDLDRDCILPFGLSDHFGLGLAFCHWDPPMILGWVMQGVAFALDPPKVGWRGVAGTPRGPKKWGVVGLGQWA